MKANSINLTTEGPEQHELVIVHDDGMTHIILNPNQLFILIQQAAGALWSYYRLVPRD